MIISSKPFPSFKVIFKKDINHIEFDKKWKHFCFFKFGREALLSGLVELGLKKGDHIIIPAYICDSAIAPLRDYGFKLIYVDIDNNGNLPINSFQNLIEIHKPKAILVVHYFGFIFDINKLIYVCHKNKIKVIEDYSHSFQSQLFQENICKSDMEIYSMRKSLPVADGGAFRIKNRDLKAKSSKDLQKNNSNNNLLFLALRFLESLVIKVGINLYNPSFLNFKKTLLKINQKPQAPRNHHIVGPSNQLKYYLGNENYLNSRLQKIQKNFNFLINSFKNDGYAFPFESFNIESIPQVFLVKDKTGGLLKYMNSRGIGAYSWPNNEMPDEVRINSSLFPNAISLDKTLVLLPIHQDIDLIHLNYIVLSIKEWCQNNE